MNKIMTTHDDFCYVDSIQVVVTEAHHLGELMGVSLFANSTPAGVFGCEESKEDNAFSTTSSATKTTTVVGLHDCYVHDNVHHTNVT
jgi:hypothetical protein